MKKRILNSLFLSVFFSSSVFFLGCETLDINSDTSETPVVGRVESTAIIPPRANPNKGGGGRAIGAAGVVLAVGMPLAKKAGEKMADQTPCQGMTEQKCTNAANTANSSESSADDKEIAKSYIKYCCP